MTTTRTIRNAQRRKEEREKETPSMNSLDPPKLPEKEPTSSPATFPLAASIADALGDVPAGTPITMAQFEKCMMRLVDIRLGTIKRPNTQRK